MTTDDQVTEQVSRELGMYVYILVDPRDSRPFYVGKGQGVRFLSHGRAVPTDALGDEGPKAARIRGIRAGGGEPQIWVARYGLKDSEYTAVEAALIDVLMSFPIVAASKPYRPLEMASSLANARRESTQGHGIILLDQLVADFAAPLLATSAPLLLITSGDWERLDGEVVADGRLRYGKGFKREWYDSNTRAAELDLLGLGISAWWRLSPTRVKHEGIAHAVAIYRGVTRGMFAIEADSWERRPDGRWGFSFRAVTSGRLFNDVVGLRGHRVPSRSGAQNPIYYWPRTPAVA